MWTNFVCFTSSTENRPSHLPPERRTDEGGLTSLYTTEKKKPIAGLSTSTLSARAFRLLRHGQQTPFSECVHVTQWRLNKRPGAAACVSSQINFSNRVMGVWNDWTKGEVWVLGGRLCEGDDRKENREKGERSDRFAQHPCGLQTCVHFTWLNFLCIYSLSDSSYSNSVIPTFPAGV